MASIGLREAARITGRSQSTIHRAMKAGRLSFTVNEADGRRIDTAELDRVFGIKLDGVSSHASAESSQRHHTQAGGIAVLQRLLDERDRLLDERDQRLSEREETIRDLRA